MKSCKKWTLKNSLLTILLIIILPSFIFAKNPMQGEEVDIYYKNIYYGSLKKEHFVAMVKASNAYAELIEAEKEHRVVIILKDNPWEINTEGKIYTTDITIVWYNRKKEKVKEIVLKAELEIPKDGSKMPVWRKIYRDVSEVGFPLSIILNILFITILAL